MCLDLPELRYRNENAAVRAPTRITGMYAISNGTQPMRSRNKIPHETIPYYPDLLREAGCHTSNSLSLTRRSSSGPGVGVHAEG